LTFNDEEPIKLSPKENELLKMLILHENDLMPRELALTKIWRDDNYFTSRSMDVYIAKLRKYLKLDDNVEILNIHGEGFRLVVKNKVEKKKAPRNRSFFRFFFIRPTKD
jgi:DNA-binding response OmpR family regulator